MSELPTGTVAFLFTDIEGSTTLVTALGDDYAVLLADHHRLMRVAISETGGVEIGTEGDAFFVVFASAASAIDAAVAAQRALARHEWPREASVRVRMGVHSGDAVVVGDNYGGIDVHRAARIAAAGHGGQILLSKATAALVEPVLPDGTRLMDLGKHRLKDIENPEQLFQLSVEGLPDRFPALRTLDARPNNLLTQVTPFVAREREVKEIRALLEANRMVTLTGPGGTGKTRLGLEVAQQTMPGFSDGAFFVPLAPVVDPELIPSTIAQNLGVREEGTSPIQQTLQGYLADKEMLLVLDNFEQVLEGAGFVSALVAAAAQLKVLTTSRAALHVYGESQYPVPPMALPDLDHLPALSSLSQYEAVALFVQRAKAVRPDFELTSDNAEAVAKICARLDGLPLALELAAARVKLLRPRELVDRLENSLSLLTGGARDLPARQQTLRDAIRWSHDLLDDAERALFRRLGVFVGGWTLTAADQICDPASELGMDIFDGLERLSEHSLIRRFETDVDQTRFRMLLTIREFAVDALENCGEREEVRRRHAHFFLDLAESANERITKDEGVPDQLVLEHDNLRSALRWSIDHDEAELGLRMGAALWRFWQMRAHLTEGKRWLTELLALPGATGPSVARASTLIALGSITYWQNDFDQTRQHYQEALDLYRALGDRSGLAEGLYNAGFVALIEFDHPSASAMFGEALNLHEGLGDEKGIAHARWGLAMAAVQARDLDTALRYGRECLEAFQKLGDWWGRSLGEWILFQVARFSEDWPEARRLMLASLDESSSENLASVASSFQGLAQVELATGDPLQAVRFAGVGAVLREKYGGGAPLPLTELTDPRAEARSNLNEEQIVAAWEEGRTMPLEEAIALARKEEA